MRLLQLILRVVEEFIAMQPVLCGLIQRTRVIAGRDLVCMHLWPGRQTDSGWRLQPYRPSAAPPVELDPACSTPGCPHAVASPEREGGSEPSRYRIWATERATLSSVLIEDSAGPVSSPSWSPDGHALAYLRLVPRSPLNDLVPAHGSCELVVQEAMDRKRVVATIPDVELDRDQRVSFPSLTAAWSPDGLLLAVPRPGRSPAVLIVHADRGAVVRTIDSATSPSWSPDGSKLAFYRPGQSGQSEPGPSRGRPGLRPRPLPAVAE